jgi:hypothetical protein
MKAFKRAVGSWAFIPAADRELPAAEQTRIWCRQLTQEERMYAWDNLNWTQRDTEGNVVILPRTFTLARELCIAAIESIENFPAGDPKPWPKDGSADEKMAYLNMMDDYEMLRIGQAIRNKALLEDEVKNS